jgi:hypothetical protein
LSRRKQPLDTLFTGLLKYRKYLAECDAQKAIPNFAESKITIQQCPIGAWSTPLIDIFVLLKAAQGFRSHRILELGSYRGETARLLAENTPSETTICAVDIDPRHGASYRVLPIANRIERRTGAISESLFQPDEKYDLIFVDANHDFDSVANDTQVALAHLNKPGVVFWHDYHHESYFHGMAGVPEALSIFAQERPIIAIRGTWLAMHSTIPGWETEKLIATQRPREQSVWTDEKVRG